MQKFDGNCHRLITMVHTFESKLCSLRKKKGNAIPAKNRSLCKLDATKKNHVGLFDFGSVSWIWDRKNDDKIEKLSLVKDCISELPDDVLVAILSRLKLKEAARTSVLSKRWRYLWAFSQGILEFDVSDFRSLEVSVNNFLNSHRAPTLDELRIRFITLGVYWWHFGGQFYSWTNVVIGKRVKKLVLDFRNSGFYPSEYDHSLGSSSFSSLVSLHMTHNNASPLLIPYFLSNSPLLEELCVAGSCHLDHLRICGSSLKLKHLDLRYDRIQILEISAPNLESFQYHESFHSHELFLYHESFWNPEYEERTSIFFYDVPRLTHVSFRGRYCNKLLAENLLDLSSFVTQLKSLVLVISGKHKFMRNFSQFPTMENLEYLQLSLSKDTDESFLIYFCLLEASPSLRRSSLKLGWSNYGDIKLEFTRSPEFTRRPKHQCLEVLQIVGFREDYNHDKLVIHLAEYAPFLEKIIIDPNRYGCADISIHQAQKLQSSLPPSVELEILCYGLFRGDHMREESSTSPRGVSNDNTILDQSQVCRKTLDGFQYFG